MGILRLPMPQPLQTGVVPNFQPMVTTDNLATITAPGYLNPTNLMGFSLSDSNMLEVFFNSQDQYGTGATYGLFQVSISQGVITLVADQAEGGVVLPTIANHIAVFNGTTGVIRDDVATAINGGNLQAGLSGTAGYLASFPSTSAKGSLHVTAVANTGDTVTTISNAAMGQATTVSIPDPAQSTASFALYTTAIPTNNIAISSAVPGVLTFNDLAVNTATVSTQPGSGLAASVTATTNGTAAFVLDEVHGFLGIMNLSNTATGGASTGTRGHINLTGAVSAGQVAAGLHGSTNFTGGTLGVGCKAAAIYGEIGTAATTPTDVSGYGVLYLDNNSGATAENGMVVDGAYNQFFTIINNAGSYVATPAGTTPSGAARTIAVKIEGATYLLLASAVYS